MLLTAVDTQTLPGLQIALADRGRNAVGALGEKWTRLMLEKSGYVVKSERKGQQRGDLRVICRSTGEIFQVEVKTARRCKDRKWRFLLWKKDKQSHLHADVVILLTVTEAGYVVPFIVPVAALADQHQAVITSHPFEYRGKLATYRQTAQSLNLAINHLMSDAGHLPSTPRRQTRENETPCPTSV